MYFWIMLFFFGICCVSLSFAVRKKQQKYITNVYFVLIWAISSFRYRIGTDYDEFHLKILNL